MKRSILLVLAFTTVAGHAAKTTQVEVVPTLEAYPGSWLNDQAFEQEKTIVLKNRKKRTPSSAAAGSEAGMSKEFQAHRDRFLKLATGEELHSFIEELDAKYETYPADLKYFAAQLIPLRAFHGVSYALVPLVAKARVLHSQLLTMVQEAAIANRVYFPQSHWKAGFAYVTEPFAGANARRVTNEYEFHSVVLLPLYRELAKSESRLKKLSLVEPITWDNKLAYGTTSFGDNLDRFRLVGEAERYATLAGLHFSMANLASKIAYTQIGGVEIRRDIGRLFGIDGFVDQQVSGVPAARRVAIIKRHAPYLKLREGGKEYMERAWNHLNSGVNAAEIWWNAVEGKGENTAYFVNPVIPNQYARELKLSFADARRMLSGAAGTEGIRSKSDSGEVVKVNLKEFYLNPPTDLKAFLPTSFEPGPEKLTKSIKEGDKVTTYTYHNYSMGQPAGWNYSEVQRVFPDAKNAEDVRRAVRVMSQSWGGWWASMTLSQIVL